MSATLADGDVWEADIVQYMQKALTSYPEAILLNLGANLGVYTLQAGVMGKKVIAGKLLICTAFFINRAYRDHYL